MRRVMWSEFKGDGIVGPARIGWVKCPIRKRLDYGEQGFRTLRGGGFKSNYNDIRTHDEYWISGCREDGRDALYNTQVEIDEDALEEYWINIRRQPENIAVQRLWAQGKCN